MRTIGWWSAALVSAGCLVQDGGGGAGPSPGGGGPAGGGPAAEAGAGGGPGGDPGAGGGPGAGGAGGEFGLDSVVPELTQEALAGAGAVTLSGTVSGECPGKLRLDVLASPGVGEGVSPSAAPPRGPLTIAPLAGTGAFAIRVPAGRGMMLTALCDADLDGFIKLEKDRGSRPVPVAAMAADGGGVDIVLDEMSRLAGGPPPGGAGGPPPGGAGGPPPGGAGGPPPGGAR